MDATVDAVLRGRDPEEATRRIILGVHISRTTWNFYVERERRCRELARSD